MVSDEEIKLLEGIGYRIAQTGERSRHLFRCLMRGGRDMYLEESIKMKEAKNKIGLDSAVEIVPINFI